MVKGGIFLRASPLLGVGAGNTPAIIDDTADIVAGRQQRSSTPKPLTTV